MIQKIFLSFLSLILLGSLTLAEDQPMEIDLHRWIGIEVGSPFYNMILEAHDKTVRPHSRSRRLPRKESSAAQALVLF